MKMIKFYAVIMVLFTFSVVNAQTELFFSIRMNNPAISDQFKSGINITTLPVSMGNTYIATEFRSKESYYSKFGMVISAGIQHPLSQKFNIGLGLDFNMVNFSRQDRILSVVSQQEATYQIGEPISTFYGFSDSGTGFLVSVGGTPKGNAKIYYLNLPVTLHYRLLNKLRINGGIALSVLASSKQQLYVNSLRSLNINNETDQAQAIPVVSRWRNPNNVTTDGDLTFVAPFGFYSFETQEVTSGSGLNRSLFMGNVGLSYNVLRSIWLDFKYNFSFTPIYEGNRQFSGKARYNFLEFGLKYDIMLPKKS